MATHVHQAQRTVRIVQNQQVAVFMIAVTGPLRKLRIQSEVPPVGPSGVTFDVLLDGVTIYASPGDRIVLGPAQTEVEQSLNIAAEKGQILTIRSATSLPAFTSLEPRVWFQAEVEDNLPTYFGGTSSSSVSVSTGSKSIVVAERELAYDVGSRIRVAKTSTPTTVWMEGIVTSYNRSTQTIVFTADAFLGTGSHTGWSVSLAGERGVIGPPGDSALGAQEVGPLVTSSMADLAEVEAEANLGKVYDMLYVTTNKACRVRLYRNTTFRTADVSRPIGTDPVSPHGVVCDLVLTGAGTFYVDLTPRGSSAAPIVDMTNIVPMLVQNRSGSPGTVTLSFGVVKLVI